MYGCRTVFLVVFVLGPAAFGFRCDRTPPDVTKPKSPSHGEYLLEINGDPSNYVSGYTYKVVLKGATFSHDEKRFTNFVLVVEPSDTDDNSQHNTSVGVLQIQGDGLIKYSDKCPNAIEHINSIGKTQITVLWTAPTNGTGCIAIRATVVESVDRWYSDDGKLTKILCAESQDNEDYQPPILEECCACHEAKYEVTFEGLWSRNTHPKDFPKYNWMTRFSDIIGASHTVNYTFWSYGGYASGGLQQLAENGNTRELERELKDKSEHIRTIIKARGISYPNITGKTFAVFRVDKKHHLMSLVSMIHPSPDWIVGVSSLELCLKNCSWVEGKTLNLYPWDAGTDDGDTYLSDNKPSNPRQIIKRITTNDSASPFHDESGSEMKPLARLILSRQRLYEKNCNSDGVDRYIDPIKQEGYCNVTEWSEWSSCSAKCGRGMRHKQRRYKNQDPDYARQQSYCKQTLTKRSSCTAKTERCYNPGNIDEDCQLSSFGPWSGCSVPCGRGTKTRSRQFKSKSAAKFCPFRFSSVPILQENVPCFERDCESHEEQPQIPEECEKLEWSEWTPCSATCGKGVKMRKKLPYEKNITYQRNRRHYQDDYENNDEDDRNDGYEPGECDDITETVECESEQEAECDETVTETTPFESDSLVTEDVDCVVSKWSDWSTCDVECGKGHQYKHRYIMRHSQNNGKKCPEKLIKKKKCRVHCKSERTTESPEDIDCVMDNWSHWSPCSHTCGPNAIRQRTRNIIVRPSGRGEPCLDRVQYEHCNLGACHPY
ncbi:spondin-1 isoform X2 [Onthophagus taurus]|uniref:spondin-1 isoform X2 n=1 Tax=Onthophagus taurus TaxID=166361 RepID=UPI000C204EDF|nr:spondin-1 isoform X2 [Onthophagus taurus]